MAQGHAVGTTGSLRRPVAPREEDAFTADQRDHLRARLHPGPLLGEEELAAAEVAAGRGQEEGRLQRKEDLAVDVLVQAVVVVRLVAQEERCRAVLSRVAAPVPEIWMTGGIPVRSAQKLLPAIGDRGEALVERRPQARDERGKRVLEVLVLAAAEPVLRHHDPAAESRLDLVSSRQARALRRAQEGAGGGVPAVPEIGLDPVPIERRDPCLDRRHETILRRASPEARLSKALLELHVRPPPTGPLPTRARARAFRSLRAVGRSTGDVARMTRCAGDWGPKSEAVEGLAEIRAARRAANRLLQPGSVDRRIPICK